MKCAWSAHAKHCKEDCMPSSHENSGLVGINLSKTNKKEQHFPGHPVIISPAWSQLHSLLHGPHIELQGGLFSVFLLMDKEQWQGNQWGINSVGNRYSPLGWSAVGELYFMDYYTQRARRHECVICLFYHEQYQKWQAVRKEIFRKEMDHEVNGPATIDLHISESHQ